MLRQKGSMPDILVMTATPIPRTLAMTVYGDLDVSVIDEMPPAKKPIRTKVFYEQHRDKVYEIIRKGTREGASGIHCLSAGGRIGGPRSQGRHADGRTLATGRLSRISHRFSTRADEQPGEEHRHEAFQSKEMNVLVATTVIEVGIDIPQASLMVIEHAERFGLSQLHQLRAG